MGGTGCLEAAWTGFTEVSSNSEQHNGDRSPALANSMHSLRSESTLSRTAVDENTSTNFSFLKTVTCSAQSTLCVAVSQWNPNITGESNLRHLLSPL